MSAVDKTIVPRRRLNPYRRRNFNWQPLFDGIDNGDTQTAVARAHKVPTATLNQHYQKYRVGLQNVDPNVVAEAVGSRDGRKRSRRALTDAEEIQIHREYKSATTAGIAVNNGELSDIAVRVYDDDHPHRTRSHAFVASVRFVQRYKHDHHISTGIVKKRHRPQTYPTEDEQFTEASEFFETVNRALLHYRPSMIINEDETSGKVVMPPRTAIRDIGSGQPVVFHKSSEKLCATIATAISSNGGKLKSALVTKGKTQLSLRKFQLPTSIVGLLNARGWMNGSTFIEYITRVILPFSKGEPCVLMCDDLPVHKTPAVRLFCEQNQIELVLVPRWGTGAYQPLDVGIFGPLKQVMRKEWKFRMRAGDRQTDTVSGMIDRYRIAYDCLTRTDVKSAFAKAGIISSRDSDEST